MRRSAVLMTATFLSLPVAAFAQQVSGLYVAAGAGGNFMQTATATKTFHQDAYTVGTGSSRLSIPAFTAEGRNTVPYEPGAVGVGSIGYGFGNGMRVEIEGNYRHNNESLGRLSEDKFGAMANVLYDLDIGSPSIFPYGGLGAGYVWTDRGFALGRTSSFAYQAILGVATPVVWVPGLSATLEYRFMGLSDSQATSHFPATASFGATSQTLHYTGDYNHSILIGLRYAFNRPVPAPAPTPIAVAPGVQPTRTYLVFFDWDRAELTDRARQIVAEVAQNSTRVQYSRIEVQGNADRSGTPAYNQRLSLQRAQVVAAELVRDGVPGAAIDIQAFGDTRPLVPTGAGVREPQNRRVAIILR